MTELLSGTTAEKSKSLGEASSTIPQDMKEVMTAGEGRPQVYFLSNEGKVNRFVADPSAPSFHGGNITGASFLSLLPEQQRNTFLQYLGKAQKEQCSFHFRMAVTEGRYYEFRMIPLDQGETLLLAHSIETVLNLNQLNRLPGEQMYRTIARAIPNGCLFIFDTQLRFILADGEAIPHFKMTSKDFEGKLLKDCITKEYFEKVSPYYSAALEGKTQSFEMKGYDGHWYNNTVAPLYNDEQDIIGGMLMCMDIQGIKEAKRQMEERLKEMTGLNERLKREVGLRRAIEDNLNAYTAELKVKNQELEQFAYVASHDLQEPLRMVSSFTQLLSKKYGDKLDGTAKEFIDFTVEGAQRMQSLISDLLDYSRVGRTNKPVNLDLNEAVAEVLHNLSKKIEETEAQVKVAKLPVVFADRTQIIQLFQNLISNALKFRRIEVSPRIEITSEERPDSWLFTVNDNGIGFDMQHSQRIFQIFQRLHTRDSIPGTGIGLALVKKIVESHGGEIWAEAVPDKGATFYFTLRKEPVKESVS